MKDRYKTSKKYENQINGKSIQENYNNTIEERQTAFEVQKKFSPELSSLLEKTISDLLKTLKF